MKPIFVWILTCLLWSTVWIFIKIGVSDLPPVSFAGLRLIVAMVVLSIILALKRSTLPRKPRDLGFIAVTGLILLGLNYGLVFWGAQYLPSGMVAVLQAMTPVFGVVFISFYLPSEIITLRKLLALLTGIIGVAIIFSDQLRISGWLSLVACLAVVGGAACVSYSYVLVKARLAHIDPFVLVAGQTAVASVVMLAVGAAMEGSPLSFNWTRSAVVSLFYLALAGSVAAFTLNYWLLKRMNSMKIMLMSVVEPPIAVFLGVLFLGESFGARAAFGCALVLVATILIMRREK